MGYRCGRICCRRAHQRAGHRCVAEVGSCKYRCHHHHLFEDRSGNGCRAKAFEQRNGIDHAATHAPGVGVHQQGEQPEVGQALPEFGGVAAVVVPHAAHHRRWALAVEQVGEPIGERLVIIGEGETHVMTPGGG